MLIRFKLESVGVLDLSASFPISYMIFFLTLQNMDASQSIDTLESMIREAALKVVNDCHSGRELSHMWPVEKSRVSPH
jgi:hypothetical protein